MPRSMSSLWWRDSNKTVSGNLGTVHLVAERPAAADEAHWRETGDGGRTALAIADAGLQAIGMDADRKTSKQSSSTKPQPSQRSRRAEPKPSGAKPKGRTPPPAVRPGTKQALLIDLLKRKKGVGAPATPTLDAVRGGRSPAHSQHSRVPVSCGQAALRSSAMR